MRHAVVAAPGGDADPPRRPGSHHRQIPGDDDLALNDLAAG